MNPMQVIVRPLMSEKGIILREDHRQYSFIVQTKATKTDVKKAIESLYDVKVTKVQTNITRGKLKRRGMHVYMQPKKKKAVITLAEGQRLSIFDDE